MDKAEDRVAVITGAAGNLGVAVAAAFAVAGLRTALVDAASPVDIERRQASLDDPSRCLVIGGVDLTDPAAAARMVDEVEAGFGRLDILVNTVGGFRGGAPLAQDDLTTWDFMLAINLRTALNACRAAIPKMTARGWGRIVNVGAGAAFSGVPGLAAYGAAKSAVMRLTESLAGELKGTGVTVNAVVPSIIDTPQNRADMPNADYSKWVAPAAIADVIAFLASDAARAVTGVNLPVFGAN
jgi:NAD(P)-dependent dehydrogenase (short-subunit alcohol dehydrogenase family)